MSKVALVVDDSLVIRRMVGMALGTAGFEVAFAANGKEALDLANTRPFDLVITDLNMPVMNGLEFISELRAVTSYKFTPIIFLTTETNDTLRTQAREAGATAWVVKPFQPEKVLSVVQRVCG